LTIDPDVPGERIGVPVAEERVHVTCPFCGKRGSFPASYTGSKVKCGPCGGTFEQRRASEPTSHEQEARADRAPQTADATAAPRPLTAEHKKALSALRRDEYAKPEGPREEQILADLVDAGLALKRGDWYVPVPSGIGGWLLLPAFGLLAAPLVTAASVLLDLAAWDPYVAGDVKALLAGEIFFLSAMVAFQIYVAVAFFQRKTLAPDLVCALLLVRAVFHLMDWLAVGAVMRSTPSPNHVFGSAIAAVIWIPYFQWSRRVQATFVVGPTLKAVFARLVAQGTPGSASYYMPGPPQLSENDYAGAVPGPGRGPGLTGERNTAFQAADATPASDAGWHVIHAGVEIGPMSLAELIGKAALGEIDPDDLVKKGGGLWTKARDVAFLQQQFHLRG
jgi:hypothetical protein